MLHSKKYLQIANVVRIVILTTFCASFVGCTDEETISIPKHLSGGEWSMWTEEYTALLRFTTESQCVYKETAADDTTVEYNYTYKYEKPNLTLTPADTQREILTGYIEKEDSKSICMRLYTPDDKEFFVALQTIYFQHP